MNYRKKEEVEIPVNQVILKGDLVIPEMATGMVIFSHGSGSSRLSKRNRMVAEYLQQRNFGTLLFDLLTREEDMQYANRFDIPLLTKRLVGVTKWLKKQVPGYGFGYFGASTGAASALMAAASIPGEVSAIVSRGGRPDLAGDALPQVKVPTLLIVGSLDTDVLQLNREAFDALSAIKKLEVVTGASHLFEEPGTMEKVCELAAGWFKKYLTTINQYVS